VLVLRGDAVERGAFEDRFRAATRQAIAFARLHVRQAVPDEAAFLVYPNQSCDENPRVGDEVVFPGDSLSEGACHGPWSAEQVVAFLWRDGKVPEWIDAAAEGVDGRRTLVGLRCCGRFTGQEALLYHRYEGGVPPFSIKSPVLPPGWVSVEASGRFDLDWRQQRQRRTGSWWRWFRWTR
jgi:hypothetical protein